MKGKVQDIKDIIESPKTKLGILLYGPNEYQVNKNFNFIYNKLNSNTEFIESKIIDSDIILNQSEFFFNEINTFMLAEGVKTVRINLSDTDKAGCLEDYFKEPTKDTFIIVKSGKLSPRSKLRNLFEKSSDFVSIPFYENTIKDANNFIENYASKNNFSISSEAKYKVIVFSGQDSSIIETNLELINLYIYDKEEKKVDTDIVEKVLSSDKPIEMKNLCNSVALGSMDDAFFCLNKLTANGTNPILIVNSLSSFFQRIYTTILAINSGKNLNQAMNDLKPPIFFKEKDNFIKQVKLWRLHKVERALAILNEGETDIKKSPELAQIISSNIVLRLTAAALR